ncbi:hypothetical protein M3I54_27690 [Paraburkholderia sp. CNPSo 3274]|nr:hypothetical protein [Paraburkholderia sp. CNPSo 3274]
MERSLVMVAGGTGLSAFLGMLDDLAHKGGCGQKVHLYYGVTNARDLCELDRLKSYEERIANFACDIVVMNPSEAWRGKTGLIPEHFDRGTLEANPFDMYVCGPPPMVEVIKTWLASERRSVALCLGSPVFQCGISQAETLIIRGPTRCLD